MPKKQELQLHCLFGNVINSRFFLDEQQQQQWHLLWLLTLTTNDSENLMCLKWQSVHVCHDKQNAACPNFWHTCFVLHMTVQMSTFSWHSMSGNVDVQCKQLKLAGGFCVFHTQQDKEQIAWLFLFVHHGLLKEKGICSVKSGGTPHFRATLGVTLTLV